MYFHRPIAGRKFYPSIQRELFPRAIAWGVGTWFLIGIVAVIQNRSRWVVGILAAMVFIFGLVGISRYAQSRYAQYEETMSKRLADRWQTEQLKAMP
jgi:hypothetical protein